MGQAERDDEERAVERPVVPAECALGPATDTAPTVEPTPDTHPEAGPGGSDPAASDPVSTEQASAGQSREAECARQRLKEALEAACAHLDQLPEVDEDGEPITSVPGFLDDDWDGDETWDLSAADEVDGAAQMSGCYPGQTAPDAASAGDRGPGVEVDPEEALDATNRARLAAILVVADRREAEVAARAAAHAATWADLAAGWACPHPTAQDLTDAEVAKEWRAASREPITRGVHRGLSIAGIHAGYHGICHEGIEGCAQVLAAHYPSWGIGYAREKVTRSIRLSRGLPATLRAWATAALDQRQVDVIVRGTDLVSDTDLVDDSDSSDGEVGEGAGEGASRSLLAEVDARLCGPGDDELAHTATLSTGALRARVRQVVAEVDAAATAERSRRAAARRSVRRYEEADGHATLQLTGPAPAVAEMEAAIHAAGQASKTDAARRNREGLPSLDPWALPVDGETDRRGIDAHRFDAAHTLITGAVAHLTGLRLASDDAGGGDGATGSGGGTGSVAGEAPDGDDSSDRSAPHGDDEARDAGGDPGGHAHRGGGSDAGEATTTSATSATSGDTGRSGAGGREPCDFDAAEREAANPEAGDSGVVVIATRNLAARWAALTGMPRPHLPHVLVGLSTLAGADDTPAQLDGYGPLPSWMSEAMLRHRGLRRMILDPLTGTLRHLDGHVYPPGHLDHLIPLPPHDSDEAEGGGEGGDGDGPGPRPNGDGPGPAATAAEAREAAVPVAMAPPPLAVIMGFGHPPAPHRTSTTALARAASPAAGDPAQARPRRRTPHRTAPHGAQPSPTRPRPPLTPPPTPTLRLTGRHADPWTPRPAPCASTAWPRSPSACPAGRRGPTSPPRRWPRSCADTGPPAPPPAADDKPPPATSTTPSPGPPAPPAAATWRPCAGATTP